MHDLLANFLSQFFLTDNFATQGYLGNGIYDEPTHLWSTLADSLGMKLHVHLNLTDYKTSPLGPMDRVNITENRQVGLLCVELSYAAVYTCVCQYVY